MAASESHQPTSDIACRSDWFRQTVLFWSSQSSNRDSGSPERGMLKDVSSSEMPFDLSHLSSIESASRCITPDNAINDANINEGDYLLDLERTTTELLKQVEEFENCLSELIKKDAQVIASDAQVGTVSEDASSVLSEEGYGSTCETQSPHLTLEFPVGSSIRDSPLYINITSGFANERDNDLSCGSECPAVTCLLDNDSPPDVKRSRIDSENESNDVLMQKYDITNRVHGITLDDRGHPNGARGDPNDERGDPNDALRNLLSGIKPPGGTLRMACVSPCQLKKQTSRIAVSDEDNTDTRHEEITCRDNNTDDSSRHEILLSTTTSQSCNNDENLLRHRDTLIQIERQTLHPNDNAAIVTRRMSKEKVERLDSGLNGMSSDSASPYPSPMVQQRPPPLSPTDCVLRHKSPGYDSGFVEKQTRKESVDTTCEVAKETHDWKFPDVSDLSSEWSPLSTIDSADFSVNSSRRSRTYSAPQRSQRIHNAATTAGDVAKKTWSNYSMLSQSCYQGATGDVTYSESELSAIRKFLTLTRKCFDKDMKAPSVRETVPLNELAMIPGINEMIEAQNKEVKDQREMIEGFMNQLGDLLIEIVNLKEEQTAVRTKQAKALALLKKQLDHHKRNQSQTYNDILEQVSVLNEKMNNTLPSEQFTRMSASPSATSVHNSRPCMTPGPPHSPLTPASTRATNYGQIIWKIPDVMRKITRIKSGVLDGTLVSSPFQTGEYEYNMNAWLYLNGRGKMVGKYVSVYACVLVGEYDAILTWPVTPTYKFTLIDQRSDPTKRQDHVRCRRVLDIAGRGENVISQNGGIPRPMDGSKALIVGLDDFIAHDQLLLNRYLVDDVIFLKVEAEIN